MPISVNAKNSRKEDSRSTNLALFTSFDDVDLSTMISQSFSHFHYNSYWSNPLVNCLLHPMTHQLRYSQVTKPTMTEWMFRLYVEKMHHYWKKLYHWNQCPMSRRMMTDEVVAKVAYFHYFYRDVSLLRTRFSYDQLIVSLERTQRVKTRRNKRIASYYLVQSHFYHHREYLMVRHRLELILSIVRYLRFVLWKKKKTRSWAMTQEKSYRSVAK